MYGDVCEEQRFISDYSKFMDIQRKDRDTIIFIQSMTEEYEYAN